VVWGIRFSPDETKVAIGFGPSLDRDPRPRRVVEVAVGQPRTALREFELKDSGRLLPFGNNLSWSPSGTILVVRTQTPAMLRLDTEAPCILPKESEFGGFLSEDRMVIRHQAGLNEPTEIQILKPDCMLADSWKMSALARVLDTSPEQDLLAIVTSPTPPALVVELVTSRTHEVKQRWTDVESTPDLLFSDQGRLICGSKVLAGKPLPDVACWDTRTGAKTAEDDKIGADLPAIESAEGNFLAITDYKYAALPWKSLWEFFDLGSVYIAPKRRLIWNVRTGKEVASWGMGGLPQEERWTSPKEVRTIKTKFVLSLSPTGKYVAEGGSGSVSVFAVQP